MIAIGCALLSALGFYFSIGLGDQWWLAWLAPIPVLWFAFGPAKYWQTFLVAFFAYALGSSSLIRPYGELMPLPVLILIVSGPAIVFAVPVIAAKRVQQSFGGIAAMFAVAALWAGIDLASSFSAAGGSALSPSSAEVGAPILIQTASLVGFAGVTFLLGVFAAGIAASLRSRSPAPAAIAVVLFAANAAFGAIRMSVPGQSTLHVALIESDDATGETPRDGKKATLDAFAAYAAEIEKLRGQNVKLIVLPEGIGWVGTAWRGEVQATLAKAATVADATLVAGLITRAGGAQRDASWAFTPGVGTPVTYLKRHLIPVLGTRIFTPGKQPVALANGTGLEICKDMDFHTMIRRDAVALHPMLLAVPAGDFHSDGWSHGRVAIMRSVENGVPLARTASKGLMTLNDRYGRIVSRAKTAGPFKTLIGDLPLDGRGGYTVYDRIGDVFGWLCLVLGIAATAFAYFKRKPPSP
jgi:apolipoprotein N-acyltransferase